jgi:LAGLIDADG endonuclease
MLIKNFCSRFLALACAGEKLTTLLLKYVSFYTIPLKEESFVKIEKHDNHEISAKSENSNDSYPSLDNEEENKEDIKFYEWLAGIIDGDGCFLVSKKGYCSLEIVTQLRDKKILYLIKQKFGGSVKLVSGNNHLRYRLHHKKGLLNLISKINGLMRNPIRVLQLGRICEIYGIELKDSKPLTYYSG